MLDATIRQWYAKIKDDEFRGRPKEDVTKNLIVHNLPIYRGLVHDSDDGKIALIWLRIASVYTVVPGLNHTVFLFSQTVRKCSLEQI